MLHQAGHDHQTTLEKIETYLHYAIHCGDHVDEKTIEISLEASNTMEELMPTLAQKWMDQGAVRGREEGREEGVLRGQAKILHAQIMRRFGSVPKAVEQRLYSASTRDLNRFAINIFDAKSAEAVVELE